MRHVRLALTALVATALLTIAVSDAPANKLSTNEPGF